jgi:AraC-like DNA-binding protein
VKGDFQTLAQNYPQRRASFVAAWRRFVVACIRLRTRSHLPGKGENDETRAFCIARGAAGRRNCGGGAPAGFRSFTGGRGRMIALDTFSIPARASMSGHAHARALMMVVSDGSLEEKVSEQGRDVRSGGVRLSEPGAFHDLQFGDEGARCTLLEGSGPFWSRVFARALRGRASVFASMDPDDARLLADTDVMRLLRSGDLLTVFGRSLATLEHGEQREAPRWFDDARDALGGADERRVARIAASLRRDRTHFARAFAAYSGFRPVEYRALRRLAAALSALSSGAPLADVALTTGYAHQSHMTNAFRTLLGASPTQLRNA